MARFWQRTKSGFTAPAQYIQTTDSVSRPMAVMMSLVMLFVALALIVALFFAGKWAYDQIANKNSKPANPVTGITSEGATTAPKPSDTSTSNSGSTNTATVTSNGTGSAVVTSRTPGASSSTNDVQNSASPRGTTGASSTVTTTPASVPNTGTGSLLGIFVISTILGTLGYRTVLIRRL